MSSLPPQHTQIIAAPADLYAVFADNGEAISLRVLYFGLNDNGDWEALTLDNGCGLLDVPSHSGNFVTFVFLPTERAIAEKAVAEWLLSPRGRKWSGA